MKLLQDFRVQVCVCVCVVGGSVAMLLAGQLEGGLQEDPCQGQVSGEREREMVGVAYNYCQYMGQTALILHTVRLIEC